MSPSASATLPRARRATMSPRPVSARARRPAHPPLAAPDRTSAPTAPGDGGLERWRSREWQPIRYAAYRTLIDMTIFPALRDGVPLPNALRADAVRHGLIDAVTSRPTERLLRLNPGLRVPTAP